MSSKEAGNQLILMCRLFINTEVPFSDSKIFLCCQFQSKHCYQQAPHQRGRKPSGDGTELGFEEEEIVSEKIGERMEKNGEDMTGMHHHVDRSDDVLVST